MISIRPFSPSYCTPSPAITTAPPQEPPRQLSCTTRTSSMHRPQRALLATHSVAAVLALAGALGWGVGDFLGGLAARRLAVLTVLAVSQAVGLVGVLVWVASPGTLFPAS